MKKLISKFQFGEQFVAKRDNTYIDPIDVNRSQHTVFDDHKGYHPIVINGQTEWIKDNNDSVQGYSEAEHAPRRLYMTQGYVETPSLKYQDATPETEGERMWNSVPFQLATAIATMGLPLSKIFKPKSFVNYSEAEYVTPSEIISKLEQSGWKPFGKYKNASEYFYSLDERGRSALARDLFNKKLTTKMEIKPYSEYELSQRQKDLKSLPYGTPNWQGDALELTKQRLENGGFERIENAVNEYIKNNIDDLIIEAKKSKNTIGKIKLDKESRFDLDYLENLKKNGFKLSDADKQEILDHVVEEIPGARSSAVGKHSQVDANYIGQHKSDVKAHEFSHVIDHYINALRNRMSPEIFDASGTGHFTYMTRQGGTEPMARMNQLKNYFGLSENQPLTKAHIDFARKYFVRDRGYDNNMQAFLDGILDSNSSAKWGQKWAPSIIGLGTAGIVSSQKQGGKLIKRYK